MTEEEKNAAEALRQVEAEAAEAATADAIATAANLLGPTPPPSPGFLAGVSAVVEADEASRGTAPAKRPRPSIEGSYHTYVADLDDANKEFDSDLGGLELEGEDESKIRRLMVQMNNLKDDFRGTNTGNIYVEPRYQYKTNLTSPFLPQEELAPQLNTFFATLRFAHLGDQRRIRSWLELVHGKACQDEYEQSMMDYIDEHQDYDEAGYSRDDDYTWVYLPMPDGIKTVKCGGTFRTYCVGTPTFN